LPEFSPATSNSARPFAIPGLRAAAERVARAIRDKEKIVVYGDYDVDGITASRSCGMVRALGGTCEFLHPPPHRRRVWLNAEALTQLVMRGTLIVTVDCGITAIEQAKKSPSFEMSI